MCGGAHLHSKNAWRKGRGEGGLMYVCKNNALVSPIRNEEVLVNHPTPNARHHHYWINRKMQVRSLSFYFNFFFLHHPQLLARPFPLEEGRLPFFTPNGLSRHLAPCFTVVFWKCRRMWEMWTMRAITLNLALQVGAMSQTIIWYVLFWYYCIYCIIVRSKQFLLFVGLQ